MTGGSPAQPGNSKAGGVLTSNLELQPPLQAQPVERLRHPAGGRLVVWLTAALFFLILICSFWMRAPGVMVNGGEMTYDRALFLCVNCATLTGFQQSIGFNDFNLASVQGPAIVLILTLAGSLYALIAGGMAGARALGMPFTPMQVIIAALFAELVFVLSGTTALFVNGISITDALHQSLCAFGNSGAVMLTGKGHYFPPYATFAVQGVLLPLSVIGGLGLPVLMDLYYRAIGVTPRLTLHTRRVVQLTAAVYLLGVVLLLASILLYEEPAITGLRHNAFWVRRGLLDPGHGIGVAFLAASTASLNCRTAGFPFEYLHRLPRAGFWFMTLLMMIGASPAGTGGGLKTTTVWRLITGFGDVFAGRLPNRTFAVAGAWAGIYAFIAFAGFLTLQSLEPQVPPDRLIFLTISSLSNVGMLPDTRDPISIVGAGLFVMDLIMLLGRLTPIIILWWMVRNTRDADVLVA